MGIWDVISGTTDSLKRNAPDLTAVKSRCPTTDSLKRIAPDGTTAKNVCSAAYGYGSTAVTKIDGGVRGSVIPYVRNEVTWSNIAQFSTIVAKHATYEASKLVPGGQAVYNVGAKSIEEFKKSNNQGPSADLKSDGSQGLCINSTKSPSIFANIHSNVRQKPEDMEPESAYGSNIHSVDNRKPEDVISLFIMKESILRQVCDGMMVPVAPRKRTVSCTRVD